MNCAALHSSKPRAATRFFPTGLSLSSVCSFPGSCALSPQVLPLAESLTLDRIPIAPTARGVAVPFNGIYPPCGEETGRGSHCSTAGRIKSLAMGRYEHRDVGRILGEVDVVVVPSIRYENAPLVIREAFLAKKPVVTTALGGMPEWIQDGVSGLLFRPRDVADLRQTLRRFIADPSLVVQLSGHFPAVQSIAADAEAMEGHYRKILDQIT
jgi:glycosyltransferase involved in cell wall biosynthesis